MRVVSWLVQKRAAAMVRKGVSSASTVKLMRANMALSREHVGIRGLDIGAIQEQIDYELKRRGVSRRRKLSP